MAIYAGIQYQGFQLDEHQYLRQIAMSCKGTPEKYANSHCTSFSHGSHVVAFSYKSFPFTAEPAVVASEQCLYL